MNDRRLVRHFLQRRSERNHYFGKDLHAVLGDRDRSLKNSAGLHLGDLRIGNSQAAAAMSEHGIEFVQLLHPAKQRFESLQLWRFRLGGFEHRDLNHQVFAPRQELVQRRIESTDGDREAIHRAKYTDEIGALQREEVS